jgi:tyrosine-protein kinase Etk/Wzc
MADRELQTPARRARGGTKDGAPARDAGVLDLWRALVEGRWVVLAVTAVSVAAAAAYVFVTPPVYRATAVLQVEPRPSDGVRRFEDLSALYEPRSSADAEMELLRSRQVVGLAAERLGLDLAVRPRWFPVVGHALARRHGGAAPAPAPHRSLERFAWGGERIQLRWLRVPEGLVERPLTLVALEGGRYRVVGPAGEALVEGAIGLPASDGKGAAGIEVMVEALSARPGTEFAVVKHAPAQVIDDLLARLNVAERGAGTGILTVSYEAGDARRAADVVSALCAVYLEQNVERSQGEAARMLAFLETQLPTLKSRLEKAEAALTSYRENRGTVDLPIEARAAVDRDTDLDRAIAEMQVTRARLVQRYSEDHPEVRDLDRQIAVAAAQRDAHRTSRKTLPRLQLGSTQLSRSVDVAAELYLTLLNKAQELQIAKSARNGSVRLVDPAVAPYRPVRPKPALALGLGLALGLAGGLAAALARRGLDPNAEDPRTIEDGTGLPVYVTIPHSAREVSLQRSAGKGARVPLALASPDDPATELLRTLRTALGFAIKARGKVVAVSSPSAGVGKSFVCANLAHLMAAAGQRVLLVDADQRQGQLHRYFSADPGPGLAEVLAGEATLETAVKSTGTPGLDLLPRGAAPDSPAELLARPKLAEVLTAAAGRYDVVLVDTPPILAVTDALLVGRAANVNLLVLRARQHPVEEIADALELFERSGVPIQGGILNDARPGGTYGRMYPHRDGHRSAG